MHRQYHEAGFRVFGLYGADKNGICNCDNPQCAAPYKHPIVRNWQHTPEWDDEQLDTMEQFGQFDTGFGVLCEGYLIVDVDARNDGIASYQRLNDKLDGALLSAGLVVRTGSGNGSCHLYFKAPIGVSLQTKLTDYPGIDFKSSGYVVGAGSLHASGKRYEVADGSIDDIALAPTALVDLLRKPESHRATINNKQVDVSNSDIQRMLSYINPDCDHDQWIKCGMAIHDATSGAGFELWDEWSSKGGKYPNTKTLSARWDSFGKSDRPVTLGTLAHFAEMNGWEYPVEFISDEFQESVKHGLFIPVADMMAGIQKPDWILKGIIERNSINLVFGESGAGKSLFALDWAYCIGKGQSWHGHRVKKPQDVVYIAGEGHRGLTLRMQALKQKYSNSPERLFFSQRSVNLLDDKEALVIVKIIEDMAVKPAVVFVDTLHRNMVGDENKSDDMAKFFKAIEIFIARLSCAIVLVHHSGHTDKGRARGSSAIKAAVDAEFCIIKEGMTSIMACTKSKDFEGGQDVRFGIKQVELEGELFYDDDEERQVTSVYLEYIGMERTEKISKNEQKILDSLVEAINTKGIDYEMDGFRARVIDIEAWRPFAYDVLPKSNPSKDFNKARNSLESRGVIMNNGALWWVAKP